jgi:hypothetical protein
MAPIRLLFADVHVMDICFTRLVIFDFYRIVVRFDSFSYCLGTGLVRGVSYYLFYIFIEVSYCDSINFILLYLLPQHL